MDKASLMTLAASGPCLNTCKVLALHLRTGNLSIADRSSVVKGVSLAGLTRTCFDLITDIDMMLYHKSVYGEG